MATCCYISLMLCFLVVAARAENIIAAGSNSSLLEESSTVNSSAVSIISALSGKSINWTAPFTDEIKTGNVTIESATLQENATLIEGNATAELVTNNGTIFAENETQSSLLNGTNVTDQLPTSVSRATSRPYFHRLRERMEYGWDRMLGFTNGSVALSIGLPIMIGIGIGLNIIVLTVCLRQCRLVHCLRCLTCCCPSNGRRSRFRSDDKKLDKFMNANADENHYLLVPDQVDSDSEI